MASGAAPCSEQRASAGEKEKGGGGGRGRGRSTAAAAAMNTPHSHTGFGHCEACVVCGDRACNHHYYGVAACHGCKCFFWRSIKNKLKYICRGDGDCDINPNHRNACRYCRLQRCLKAGMQPDAVRMPKPMSENEMELAKLEKEAEKMQQKQPQKEAGQCPMCHNQQQQPADGIPIVHNGMVHHEQLIKGDITKDGITESGLEIALAKATPPQLQMTEKLQEERSQQLVKRLVLVEMTINEVADFSENEAPKRQLRLDSLFDYPEFLDRFRTQVNYCVRLRRVTEEEMEFCKYRTLTKVVDYIRALSTLDPDNMASTEGVDQLTVQDKIVLLRHGFAPLVLFDIAAGTSFTTKDTHNLLCLPTGLTLCAGEAIVPNTFLSQQIIGRCIGSLVRLLTELQLDQEEFVLMKLIIALALDSASEEDVNLTVVEEQSEDFPTAPMAQFCPASSTGHGRAEHGGQHPQLSAGARQFVDQLRDWAHAALYRHPPKRSSAGASSSSSSASSASSEAALRFAKLLHILPKLTLLSRDLVEHIRMVHTFPSTRTRPTDPLFFQLFGDIFHENQQWQQSRASLAALLGESSPFSGTDLSSSFGSPVGMERQQQQRDGFVQHQMMSTGGSGCPVHAKMISPQYKVEYGSSPHQWQHLDQPPPMSSSPSAAAAAEATYAIGGGMFSGKSSSS